MASSWKILLELNSFDRVKNVIEKIRQAESDNRAQVHGKLWTFLGCGLRNMKGDVAQLAACLLSSYPQIPEEHLLPSTALEQLREDIRFISGLCSLMNLWVADKLRKGRFQFCLIRFGGIESVFGCGIHAGCGY